MSADPNKSNRVLDEWIKNNNLIIPNLNNDPYLLLYVDGNDNLIKTHNMVETNILSQIEKFKCYLNFIRKLS